MKKILSWSLTFLISFIFDFSILYFFGTKDIGLCLSIAFLISSVVSNLVNKETDIFERITKLLPPIFQQLDGHINNLFEKSQNQEELISELETKVQDLESKVSELEDEIEEIKNPRDYRI